MAVTHKMFLKRKDYIGSAIMKQQKKKLLDIVREKIRVKHYSYSTERTYVHWIKQYILFHNKRHPIELEKKDIEQFLTKLAVKDKVSPGTQIKPLVHFFFFIGKFWGSI